MLASSQPPQISKNEIIKRKDITGMKQEWLPIPLLPKHRILQMKAILYLTVHPNYNRIVPLLNLRTNALQRKIRPKKNEYSKLTQRSAHRGTMGTYSLESERIRNVTGSRILVNNRI
jgi:hypothetical protein